MRPLCCLLLISLPITLRAQVDSPRARTWPDSLTSEFMREMDRKVLSGLRGMHLEVESADTALRTEVVNRLRSKGVPFVTRTIEALGQPGSPSLYVTLVEERQKGSDVYHAAVKLDEQVSIVRNRAQAVYAVTWSTDKFVRVDRNHSGIRDAVLGAVDAFINTYLDANPQH